MERLFLLLQELIHFLSPEGYVLTKPVSVKVYQARLLVLGLYRHCVDLTGLLGYYLFHLSRLSFRHEFLDLEYQLNLVSLIFSRQLPRILELAPQILNQPSNTIVPA